MSLFFSVIVFPSPNSQIVLAIFLSISALALANNVVRFSCLNFSEKAVAICLNLDSWARATDDRDPCFCILEPTNTAVNPSTGSSPNSLITYSTVFLILISFSKLFLAFILVCISCCFNTFVVKSLIIVSSKLLTSISLCAFFI